MLLYAKSVVAEILIFLVSQPPIPNVHTVTEYHVKYRNTQIPLLLHYVDTGSNLEQQEPLKSFRCFYFPGYQFPDQDLDTMSPIFLKNKVFLF